MGDLINIDILDSKWQLPFIGIFRLNYWGCTKVLVVIWFPLVFSFSIWHYFAVCCKYVFVFSLTGLTVSCVFIFFSLDWLYYIFVGTVIIIYLLLQLPSADLLLLAEKTMIGAFTNLLKTNQYLPPRDVYSSEKVGPRFT